MERPCRCPPLIKLPTLFFNLPLLLFPSSRCSNFFSLRPRVASAFLLAPLRALFPLYSLLLARRNVCIARPAEWPIATIHMSVSWISFVATRRRVYSRQACRQFGWIFINGKKDISLSLFYGWNSALRHVDRNVGIWKKGREREKQRIRHDFNSVSSKWIQNLVSNMLFTVIKN